MCGIWGFINQDENINEKMGITIIKDLLLLSESRGKEATGMAVMSSDAVNIIKRACPASEFIHSKDFAQFLEDYYKNSASGNTTAIGHSRLATNGKETDAHNNQPVHTDLITTVHNGIIVNDSDLWKKNPMIKREAQVDTEIFTKLCDCKRRAGDTVLNSITKTYNEIKGMASTLNIFHDAGCVVAATNNGSLYYCISDNKKTILFASEGLTIRKLFLKNKFLQGKFSENDICQIKANTGLIVDVSDMETASFSLKDTDKNYDEKYVVNDRKVFVNVDEIQNITEIQKPELSMKNLSKYEIDVDRIKKIRRCTKCVLPETMPFIEFDSQGVCNYCRTYKKMQYIGKDKLVTWAEEQKKKGTQNDSLVSFSGGRDSSYGLHYFVKELGLNPVAYSYDWGMVTDLARRNQSRMCSQLGVELILVSADLHKKRANIRKNVSAWLKKPDLGMIPLFMAGDKQYFYYANKVREQYGLDNVLMASNPFEKTHFKSGFCGVKPTILKKNDKDMELEQLEIGSVLRMAGHYIGQYITNPKYINTSIFDTIGATASYYAIPHNYFRLFNYIPWDEEEVNRVLINEYDWETASDTQSTWRIGDGTSPFYNYIYYLVCGFSENDTLRSNQIREGMLTREKALELVYRDNEPRFESIQWYFDTIGLDMKMALDVVQNMRKLY